MNLLFLPERVCTAVRFFVIDVSFQGTNGGKNVKRRERALRFAECPGRALPPCEGFTPVLSLNPGACATWQLCSAAAWLSRGMVYSLAAGRCGRGVVGLTLESVLFLCPMQPGRDAGQRPLHQSPPSLCLFHCCVQDSVIRKRIK